MFEFIKLTGSAEQGIELQTRLRNRIENSQAPAPDSKAVEAFHRLLKRHSRWSLRKEPCGFYNCAGHAWASRRTAIYDQEFFDLILRDDGYRELKETEEPRHGDLALYRWAGDASILHVGIISELRILSLSGSQMSPIPVPWILSKWNDSTGEVLHHYRDVPWEDEDYGVSFWTERP